MTIGDTGDGTCNEALGQHVLWHDTIDGIMRVKGAWLNKLTFDKSNTNSKQLLELSTFGPK